MRIDSPKMTNAEVTGSFKGAFSGSFEGDIQADSVSFGNVTGKPTLISGSAQIVYGDIPSIPTVGDGGLTTNDFTNADHSKLDGIEASATADQTGAEIKTALFNESDTNNLTDTLLSKLNGIEANATADQTGAEIKSAYEGESDTNAFTDALLSKLNGIEAGATTDQDLSSYQLQPSEGAFADGDKTKLDGIEASATADQSGAEIKTALFNESDTNNLTDTLLSKLNGIEASADVTDTANVKSNLPAGVISGSAADARTQLGVDAAGTDNSTDVTLGGTPDYITISGQTITRNQIDLTSDVTGILPVGNMAATALTTVQTAANESAHLALTAQEGDVVVRSDENKTYMHNGGTAGTMADYTLLATPTDSVTSVNGNTGVVTVVENVTTNLSATATNSSLTVNSSDGTDAALPAATTSAWGVMTDEDKTKLDGIETGATADQDLSSYQLQPSEGAFADGDKTKLDGIEAGATADQDLSSYQLKPSEGAFANGDKTKLDGITAGANAYAITDDNASNVHFEGLMVGQTSGATANTIRCVGDVVAYYSSDAQFKDNVKPLEGALDKVKQIRGVTFDWNDKQDVHEGHDIGVIAQEVETVYPELVHHREHNDSKAVDYVKLTAVLIEAVKELEQKVVALEKK